MTLNPSPFADHTQILGTPQFAYNFDPNTLVMPTTLQNPGPVVVTFGTPSNTALDVNIFTVSSGANGYTSPLIVNSITNPSFVGSWLFVYKVNYLNYPSLQVTSAPITVTVSNSCTLTPTTQNNPAPFNYGTTPV